MSKMSVSVSSGLPKHRESGLVLLLIRGILEPLMKHEVGVFDMASQMKQ